MKECRTRIPDLLNAPWAILPAKLEEIQKVYYAHLSGEPRDLSAFEAKFNAATDDNTDEPDPYEVVDGVAIIPIQGTISRRMNLFSMFSGGVSTELLLRDFRSALADPLVDAILLSVDSPGGAVGGLTIIANEIYSARGQKPILAYAADMMASAAYWIGSAADYLISEDTSVIGSIGVVTLHTDRSQADVKAGVKRTYITAGKYKAIGNDAEQLSQDARATIEAELDYYYSLFVNAVARNRGVTAEAVLTDMADGRVFIGAQAQAAGLIDHIGTIDDALLAAMSMVESQKPKYLIRR